MKRKDLKEMAPTNDLAASRPSPKAITTVAEALACLTRSLVTKSGEAPSAVNRIVRKSYGLLLALEHDFPGQLGEVVLRMDLCPRELHHSATWYGRYLRGQILAVRHEQEQAVPPSPAIATLVQQVLVGSRT